MSTPPDDYPMHEFQQLMGTRFHQEAFDDEIKTVDEALDDFLGDDPRRPQIRAAIVGGHRLLAADLDDDQLGDVLEDMGFMFVPELLGYDGHRGFVEHVLARLERALHDAEKT
jgi:hypothetical protein